MLNIMAAGARLSLTQDEDLLSGFSMVPMKASFYSASIDSASIYSASIYSDSMASYSSLGSSITILRI